MGQTFVNVPHVSGKRDKHLWIVIAKQGDQVALVSLTTLRPGKDQHCIVGRDEHRWVIHDSVVFYEKAGLAAESWLDGQIKAGAFKAHDDLRAEVLQRVIAGARTSKEIPTGVKKFVGP